MVMPSHDARSRVSVPSTLVALWRLGRYRFLGGGFVLHALGGALARERGPIELRAYAVGQGFITATQLMTHYCNGYFDQAADAANLARTTGSTLSEADRYELRAQSISLDPSPGVGAVSLISSIATTPTASADVI